MKRIINLFICIVFYLENNKLTYNHFTFIPNNVEDNRKKSRQMVQVRKNSTIMFNFLGNFDLYLE